MDDNATQNVTSDVSTAGVLLTKTSWTVCLAVNCSLLLVHLWIAGATIIYAVKTRKRRSSLAGGRVIICAALATVVTNFRYFTTFSLLMTTLQTATDSNCELVIDTGKVMMILAMFFIMCFFWIRQRAFYNHPSIGQSFGKCASISSFCSITLLVGMLVVTLPLSVFPTEYEAQLSGIKCGFKNDEKHYSFRNYMYGITSLSAQVILLGLFVHPLRMHYQAQRAANITPNQNEIPRPSSLLEAGSSKALRTPLEKSVSKSMAKKKHSSQTPQSPEKTGKTRSQHKQARVYTLIRRTLILAAITVVTDLVAMAIISAVSVTEPQVITRIIYDVDLSVNTVTVVLSFENWRKIILWPFVRHVSHSPNIDTQITSTTIERKAHFSTVT